jgi:hypothetical protein
VRLFIDSIFLLAAAGSAKGASRFVLNEAEAHGWKLISSDYCVEETRRNLPKLGRAALSGWQLAVSPRREVVRASTALPPGSNQ